MLDTQPLFRRIIIVGATSAIANQCAKIWLTAQSAELILIGRDELKLKQITSDLKIRSPQSSISSIFVNFLDEKSIQETTQLICEERLPDIVLIAQGALPNQEECQHNLNVCRAALEINGISPILFTEGFAKFMAKADFGRIIVIGSVAGDRGRQSNYVYGAAKAMVHRYIEGLQHRIAGHCHNLSILLVKPGPTATPMTRHLQAAGASLASAETVALEIVEASNKHKTQLYTPKKWGIIMFLIRHLPSFIFNKIRI
ncbi:SDR family NAD(P)-dependent oxidoreductase [Acidovorax sp. DW039]|uniref:SDR family NAD(P)-dependent oxidoreductase n=1 Tax=Acidovorax sp. DW039 TaxID=3095606 RepID=UPI00308DAF65|nr:SDR family NAD(P)-dependent oxidoreductase [Acidovorax sp. DW039]